MPTPDSTNRGGTRPIGDSDAPDWLLLSRLGRARGETRGGPRGRQVQHHLETAPGRVREAAAAPVAQRQPVDDGEPEAAAAVLAAGSVESRDVTGRMFELEGGKIRVAEGWAHGPQVDKGARWDPAELGPVVADLLARARPPVPVYGA